tara:strand:- start:266 stop:526 length:261 start_codon:yes stop_codon:yes gene_type:complete
LWQVIKWQKPGHDQRAASGEGAEEYDAGGTEYRHGHIQSSNGLDLGTREFTEGSKPCRMPDIGDQEKPNYVSEGMIGVVSGLGASD